MSKLYAFLPLALVLLLGCQKKEAEDLTQLTTPEAKEVLQKKTIASTELGFATRLPKDAEFYASIHHPGEILKAMILMDVTELLFTTKEVVGGADQGEDDDPDETKVADNDIFKQDEIDEMMAKMDEAMIGNAFVCVDRGLAKNISTMGDLYQDLNAAQAKLLAKILARLLKMENPLLAGEDALLQEFIEDAFSGFAGVKEAIENGEDVFEMPNVYFGCQPPEGESEEWRKEWVSSLAEMAEEQNGVEKIEFEKYGTQFQGVKLKISQLFLDAAETGGEELQKELGDDVDGLLEDGMQGALADQSAEWFDLLSKRFQKLTMVLALGEVDGHLVMFFGKNADALVLVDKVEDSLAGKPNFAQLGQGGGRLMGAWYASEDLIKSFQSWRGYEKSYRALATAFEQEKLPNSDKIVKNFNALADLEHELIDHQIDDYLMLCVWDKGLRIDSIGGREDLDLDFSQPLQLLAVAESVQDEYFLKAHWRSDQKRQAMRMHYAEHLVSVIGHVIEGGYLAFLERDEDGAEWYEEGEIMYEKIVAPEAARLWGAYRKLCHQALDGEVAVLIDLNGEMPRVPSVPKSFIEEGKVPRLIIARPISDREALSSAYADFETTAKNVLEYTAILTETELPMPDFLSSDKGDLKTWFYPFPMMTDDFVPGVSVSDSLLMFGTSKNWAEKTYTCWEKRSDISSGDDGLYGSFLELQFKPLWDFTNRWLDLAEKESKLEKKEKKKSPDEDEAEPFDYDKARKILERARAMKSIHWHRSMEHGKTRSKLEFRMGD